jgi:simple sugar transport system ATP-binding protein
LEVQDLKVNDNRNLPAVKGVSFDIRKGEILGIAGVAGNGQSELEDALTGLRKKIAGTVTFNGVDISTATPRDIREAGMSHIAADRYKYAMVKEFTVAYNIALGRHYKQPFADGGFLNHRKINAISKELVKKFDVRPPEIQLFAENLSGGNQQKMVVAREFDYNPLCMVVSQPTRGLDIGAIEFIHSTILDLRQEDVAILLISMELEEILSLSDRILVMYEGQIMGEVTPDEVTMEELGLMMAGSTLEEARSEAND